MILLFLQAESVSCLSSGKLLGISPQSSPRCLREHSSPDVQGSRLWEPPPVPPGEKFSLLEPFGLRPEAAGGDKQAASALLLVSCFPQRAARTGCASAQALSIPSPLFPAPKEPLLTGTLPWAWCRQCRASSSFASAPGMPRELAMANSSLTASTTKTHPTSGWSQERGKAAMQGRRKAQELKRAGWRA